MILGHEEDRKNQEFFHFTAALEQIGLQLKSMALYLLMHIMDEQEYEQIAFLLVTNANLGLCIWEMGMHCFQDITFNEVMLCWIIFLENTACRQNKDIFLI